MSDNTQLSTNIGSGDIAATAEVTFSGDTAKAQIIGPAIISGAAESYVANLVVGGAGAVAAGVQRVTLASDDPAVTDLAAIEVLLTAANVDHAANEVLLTTIAGDTTSIDGKITACNTGAVVVSSGTITANLGATDTANLAAVESNTAYGAETGGGVEASALRVTIASDSTGVLTVDGTVTANLSATDNAVLDTIATNTTGLNGTVSGSEVQVDVVAALPSGTNAIGKLSANSGVDIGDVDVTSISAGTNVIGATIARPDSSGMFDGTTALTVKRTSGVAAGGAPGTDTAAAVAGKKIRVLAIGLFATSTTTNNVFIDNADNDLLFNTGNPLPLSIDADGDTVAGFVLPHNPGGWFETDTANEALTLNTSAAQDIAYTLTYVEVA